jgi:Secretion system C-terminal sorting domain
MIIDSIIAFIFGKINKPYLSHILNARIMYKKNILLFLFLAQVVVAFAQITLEHTYNNESFIRRYNFPINGEIYFPYSLNSTATTFNIYGKNHAILRQIPFSGNALWQSHNCSTITETPNGSLRFLMTAWDSTNINPTTTYILADERGNALFSQLRYPAPDSFGALGLLKDIGLPDRLTSTITNKTAPYESVMKLYDLNGQNPKQLSNTQSISVTRINLEVSGEKFYHVHSFDSLTFYNADLTFWKSFKIPSGDILNISQKLVNSDSLIEVICVENGGLKILTVNELGQQISSVPIAKRGSSVRGDDKIALIDANRQFNLYTFRNGVRFVNTYPAGSIITWQDLGAYGLKYILSSQNSDKVRIYNEDQTLWKVIRIPYSPNFQMGSLSVQLYVEENRLNNTSELRLIYVESSWSTANTNVKYINENGVELLKVENGSQFTMSVYLGLSPKLLVWSNSQKWTKVYGFPNLTYTSTIPEKLSAQVFPNPFDKTLTIKLLPPNVLASQRLKIQIVDLAGKILIQKETVAENEILLPEAADLPTGFYFLKIRDTENHQTVLKIVKN